MMIFLVLNINYSGAARVHIVGQFLEEVLDIFIFLLLCDLELSLMACACQEKKVKVSIYAI